HLQRLGAAHAPDGRRNRIRVRRPLPGLAASVVPTPDDRHSRAAAFRRLPQVERPCHFRLYLPRGAPGRARRGRPAAERGRRGKLADRKVRQDGPRAGDVRGRRTGGRSALSHDARSPTSYNLMVTAPVLSPTLRTEPSGRSFDEYRDGEGKVRPHQELL